MAADSFCLFAVRSSLVAQVLNIRATWSALCKALIFTAADSSQYRVAADLCAAYPCLDCTRGCCRERKLLSGYSLVCLSIFLAKCLLFGFRL